MYRLAKPPPAESMGIDPESQGKIFLKEGRFGPYLTDGKTNVSLGKKIEPKDVTLEIAIAMLKKSAKRHQNKWKGRGDGRKRVNYDQSIFPAAGTSRRFWDEEIPMSRRPGQQILLQISLVEIFQIAGPSRQNQKNI